MYIYSETDSILNSESSGDDYDSDTTSLCSDLDLGLRSSMVEERLNALTLMYFHKDVHIDTEEVVTLFAQAKPKRRLELL